MRLLLVGVGVVVFGLIGCRADAESELHSEMLMPEADGRQPVRLPERDGRFVEPDEQQAMVIAERVLGERPQSAKVRLLDALGRFIDISAAISRDGRPVRMMLRFSARSGYLLSVTREQYSAELHKVARETGARIFEQSYPTEGSWLLLTNDRPVPGLQCEVWLATRRIDLGRPGTYSGYTGDFVLTRISRETGDLVYYAQWVAEHHPDGTGLAIGDKEAIAIGERFFTERGLALEQWRVRRSVVLSWAYHATAGPIYYVSAYEQRGGNDGVCYPTHLVVDAMTGDVLVSGEGTWWDFTPEAGQHLPRDPGVGYPFRRMLGGMWGG